MNRFYLFSLGLLLAFGTAQAQDATAVYAEPVALNAADHQALATEVREHVARRAGPHRDQLAAFARASDGSIQVMRVGERHVAAVRVPGDECAVLHVDLVDDDGLHVDASRSLNYCTGASCDRCDLEYAPNGRFSGCACLESDGFCNHTVTSAR